MLQRLGLYEEREAVGAVLTSLNTNITLLNSGRFEAISQCLQALSAFNHATVELSTEKVVTASKIIPIDRMLFHKINEKAHKLTTTAIKQLDYYQPKTRLWSSRILKDVGQGHPFGSQI